MITATRLVHLRIDVRSPDARKEVTGGRGRETGWRSGSEAWPRRRDDGAGAKYI